MTRSHPPLGRRTLGLVGLALTSPLFGCKDFLSVTDPDIIVQANSAASAVSLHNGAVLRLAQAVSGTQGPDALFMFGGLLADEWRSGDTFVQRNNQDQRIWDPTNTFNAGPFRNLNRVRTQARAAIDGLRAYSPTPLTNIGRMFAVTAYVEVLLGEHYCNGIPLDSVAGTSIAYGNPLSDDSVFALAIAHVDSALTNLAGADSASVANFAKVIKGRALVDRADFVGASAAVAAVPTTYHYDVTHSVNPPANVNQINALNNGAKRYTVADTEGVNGLPFVSARDPRVPTQLGKSTDLIFDSQYGFRVLRQGIWGQTGFVKIATGIEARLIEAEAALQTQDTATWLSKLNIPRADATLLPVPLDTTYRPATGTTLAPLADPGTPTARAKLMFSERAFWMFSTGHRLGDMRREVRQYGSFFSVNTVYPIGAWFKGGVFGDAIQMAIPVEEQNNPNFHGCTDRNP